MEEARRTSALPSTVMSSRGTADTQTEKGVGGIYVVKPVDKQSLEYVLRSGLAGGLAGCAVSSRGSRTSSS